MSRAYFDSVADRWDLLRDGFFKEAVRDHAVRAAGVERGRTAVDVGAGTGFVTQALTKLGVNVVAVDQSPSMLEALSRQLGDCAKIDCRVGSAEQLPVADRWADYCFANMLLHHVEAPGVAIREMARVVRPLGRVVVTDLDAHDHEFLRTEHHDRWMGFERDDIRQWFHDARLVDVRVESIGEDCRARSTNGERAAVGIFLAVGTVAASDRSTPAV